MCVCCVLWGTHVIPLYLLLFLCPHSKKQRNIHLCFRVCLICRCLDIKCSYSFFSPFQICVTVALLHDMSSTLDIIWNMLRLFVSAMASFWLFSASIIYYFVFACIYFLFHGTWAVKYVFHFDQFVVVDAEKFRISVQLRSSNVTILFRFVWLQTCRDVTLRLFQIHWLLELI